MISTPTPVEVRDLLLSTGLPRAIIAVKLHVSRTTVDQWLAGDDTKRHRNMPASTWALAKMLFSPLET